MFLFFSQWVVFDSFVTPWAVAHQAPLSMELSRQEHWSGQPFPSPGDLPNPGAKLASPALPADSTFWAPGKPHMQCPYWWPYFQPLLSSLILGWPKCSFTCSYMIVWKNPNELFGQANIKLFHLKYHVFMWFTVYLLISLLVCSICRLSRSFLHSLMLLTPSLLLISPVLFLLQVLAILSSVCRLFRLQCLSVLDLSFFWRAFRMPRIWSYHSVIANDRAPSESQLKTSHPATTASYLSSAFPLGLKLP